MSGLTVAVAGARCRRQGTGEWVARAFHRAGCRVAAVLGTSAETVAVAREALAGRHGIEARGYLDMDALLAAERPDLVAVCTPPSSHLALARKALAAGAHVFCEKPLHWSPDLLGADGVDRARAAVEALLEAAGDRAIGLNEQWPCSLGTFGSLHPEADLSRPPARLEMWLAPLSNGPRMVVDSASHPLSLLRALCGPGELGAIRADWDGDDWNRLMLGFEYLHSRGATSVQFVLNRCPEPPRPAGYALDGLRAEREVELPDYRQFLVAGDRRVALPDPLEARVREFLGQLEAGGRHDARALVAGTTQLVRLVHAAAAGMPTRQERS